MKLELVKDIYKIVDDKFAKDINIIDFESRNPFTDYFIICEVDSSRQIDAIVNEVVKQSKEEKFELRAIDGKGDSGWVVLDLYNVVLHVFSKETRKVYELDKLFLNHKSLTSDDLQ